MKGKLIIILLISLVSCKKKKPIWGEIIKSYQSLNNSTVQEKKTTLSYLFLEGNKLNKNHCTNNACSLYVYAKTLFSKEDYYKCIESLDLLLKLNKNEKEVRIINFHATLLKIESLIELGNIEKAKQLLYTLGLMKEEFHDNLKYYFNLKYCFIEAKYYRSINKYNLSLASTHYGLHILDTKVPEYQKLKNQFLSQKATTLLDRFENDEKLAIEILEQLKTSAQTFDKRLAYISNLINAYSYNDQKIEAENMINEGISILDSASIYSQNYFLISSLFKFMIFNEKNDGSSFATNFSPTFTNECAINKFIYNLYRADFSYGNEREKMLKSIYVPRNCNKTIKQRIEFYKNTSLISNSIKENLLDETIANIKILYKNRQIAKDLYKGDLEFHLNNYYSDNCAKIYNLLVKKESSNIPEKYHKMVLDLYQDTRNKNFNHTLRTDINSDKEKLSKSILSGLSMSNDYRTLDNYSNPQYPILYNSLKEKEILDSDLYNKTKNPVTSSFVFSELKDQLRESKTDILLFMVTNSKYWYIKYDGINMKINSLNDTIISRIQNISYSKKDNFNYNISNVIETSNKRTYVVCDGIFEYFPFYSIPNSDYIFISKLSDISKYKPLILNSNKSSFFSFSDPFSRSSLKKQEIGELYNDFEECNDINNLFKSKGTFYHGSSFNLENLKKHISSDILHIATHGVANINNRLSNFFYIREKKGISKLYLHDIYNFKKFPKFVALSMCNSGKGRHQKGIGTFSLSRPFYSNGTQTILKTIWKTDDEASKLFMVKFYSNWLEGNTIEKAIKLTHSYFKNHPTYSDPYYWAGFVLEGNPNLYLK